MFFLLLHIVFASSFTLLIKYTQQRAREDVVVVGSINYIVAALAVWPVFLSVQSGPVSLPAVLTGAALGTTYFVAFFFVIFAIKTVGASSTTVVSVLSILIPISLAAVWYGESPSFNQSLGIGLALLSLLLITGGRKPADRNLVRLKQQLATDHDQPEDTGQANPRPWLVPIVLLTFFMLCGLNRVYQDAFKHLSTPDQRPAFLAAAFLMAAIPSLVVLIRRGRVPLPTEFAIGVPMGLANCLQTFFVLRALQQLEGFIVFTLASCGAIVLTTVVAVGLMGERISRRAQLGISLAVVALVLLRWLPGNG